MIATKRCSQLVRVLLISSVMLNSINLFSQNFIIEGKITPIDSTTVVNGLHIINNTTKRGNITDEGGNFELSVKVGDNITISGVQIKKTNRVISKQHQTSKKINIYVYPKSTLLKEVKIVNNASVSLFHDPALLNRNIEVNAKSLKLPFAGTRKKTQTERAIYTATTSSGGVSLDLIINMISGRLKMLKKRKQREDINKTISYLEGNFKYYLLTDLSIDKNKLEDFLHFCYEDINFDTLYQKGEIYLVDFFKQKAIAYKKRKNCTSC